MESKDLNRKRLEAPTSSIDGQSHRAWYVSVHIWQRINQRQKMNKFQFAFACVFCFVFLFSFERTLVILWWINFCLKQNHVLIVNKISKDIQANVQIDCNEKCCNSSVWNRRMRLNQFFSRFFCFKLEHDKCILRQGSPGNTFQNDVCDCWNLSIVVRWIVSERNAVISEWK